MSVPEGKTKYSDINSSEELMFLGILYTRLLGPSGLRMRDCRVIHGKYLTAHFTDGELRVLVIGALIVTRWIFIEAPASLRGCYAFKPTCP